MAKISRRSISLLLSLVMVLSMFTVLPVAVSAATGTVKDTLTADGIGTGTSYSTWSDKVFTSDAVYAGWSMKSSAGAIQLNTSKNYGIVSTGSGGTVKAVTITVSSGSNQIDVYGSNTAYSAVSDLYGSNSGTVVGSLTATGTVTFEDDYQYIGIRSKKGAIYLTSIEIEWKVEDDTPSKSTHTVTWNNYNGTPIKSDTIEEETDYTYTGETPQRDATAEYTYAFSGWKLAGDDTLYTNDAKNYPHVTGDLTYTAQYNESPRTYTVKWVDEDGTTPLKTLSDVAYGATPTYGADPSKAADAQYTYAFTGWIPAESTVIADITYVAQYHRTVNTYTVTWKNEDGTVLETDEDVAYGETPTFDGTQPTKAETDTHIYTFAGWNPDVTTVTGNAEYTAKFTAKSKFESVDTLNRELTGISGTTYGDWSGKTGESGAVYAGQSAGGNDSIQLRSSGNNSGIVTTTSGGKAAKVSVTWNSGTANGRTLNIYGKNSAYSSATDLYSSSSSTSGELIGTIVYGTSTELDITGDYAYIGIRSNSGALYLDEVQITWSTGAEIPAHTVTWLNYDGGKIYSEQVKENTVPSFDSEHYTYAQKPDDENYTYRFSGWVKYNDADTTVYSDGNLPKVADSDVSYQAYFTQRSKFSEVDILTADDFIATNTTYKAFKDIAYTDSNDINSEAVYAGNSARDGGAIQLNATSPHGIVTTTSGGRAAKIAVSWASKTPIGRTLNIYGKDSAYDRDNWYSSSGTLLGTIVCGTDTELELTAPYEYIAIRSANSAVYLDRVEITWDTTPPVPHTVTWMNGEDEIYHETVAYNARPSYDADTYGTPQKDDDDYHYTFTGWVNGSSRYDADATLPAMKKDVTYTAEFSSVPIHTVTWKNFDGADLETDKFYGGETVQAGYDGTTPVKAANDLYTYTFLGWKDSSGSRYYTTLPELSESETFTALYSARPNYHSGRIVSTTDDTITYDVGGKYYMLSGDDTVYTFDDDASFADHYDIDGTVLLGNAVISVFPPTESTFAHTLYVTGEGTAEAPFVFYPNFIHSDPAQTEFSLCYTNDIYDIHPGDAFMGLSKIRMHDAYIRFLQYEDQPDLECAHGTNGFMGISATRYGNRYEHSTAQPYDFVSGSALYYLGELNNAHNFSEELVLDTELGEVTPAYTVTWANWNGDLIRTNKVYQGFSPSFGSIAGSDPTRSDDDDYRYTFSGWKNESTGEIFGISDTLPVVTGDVTYTATYTFVELAVHTITWYDEDGSLLGTSECKDGKNPVYPHDDPTKVTDSEYIYAFGGWTDGITEYPAHKKLPAAFGDAFYTAYYTKTAIPDAPGTYTVTWEDWDGTELEKDYDVPEGSTPSYDGEEPTREPDAEYSYTFNGWFPHLKVVTFDITYTAQYAKTPLNPVAPIADIENIFPTDDGMGYDLSHMYYLYHDEILPFDNDVMSVFSSDGATVTLGGKTVADIGVEKNNKYDPSWYAEFINTVFVTGTGSHSDPFVFHPNYQYYGTKNNIGDGCTVALDRTFYSASDKIIQSPSYPGDRYQGNTRVKIGSNAENKHPIQFLDYSNDYVAAEQNFIGIGKTTYGTNYSGADAKIGESIHYFNSGNDTLWYHGEDENHAYVFAEEPPVYQRSFGDPESFTVTWKNDDGAVLETQSCYYDDVPAYSGTAPQRSSDAIRYEFSGWTPEVTPVTGDAAYTAVYTAKKFFARHSLTLKGDIGIYFYIDVNAAGITPNDIQNGDYTVSFNFSWDTSPAPYTDLSVDDIVLSKDNYSELYKSGYFKIKCNTAVAEMSCMVHANAVVTKTSDGSEAYTDSENYSVRDYGMTILNNSSLFSESVVDLVKAMLDYGAKAQVVFNIIPDDPANRYVEDYTMDNVTAEMIDAAISAANAGNSVSDFRSGTSGFGLEYYGSTLVFLSETTLRHYYTITNQSVYNSVKNDTTFDLNESKLPFVIFEHTDIPASELDTLQEFTINGQTYYYSALDYSRGVLSSAKADTANRQLAMATYWYNKAANEHFK